MFAMELEMVSFGQTRRLLWNLPQGIKYLSSGDTGYHVHLRELSESFEGMVNRLGILRMR